MKQKFRQTETDRQGIERHTDTQRTTEVEKGKDDGVGFMCTFVMYGNVCMFVGR